MENKTPSADPKTINSNNKVMPKTIWARISNPLLFVTVSLFAAFGLIGLLSLKTNFDKEKNKPLVVVDSSDESPREDVNIKTISEVFSKIEPGIDPKQCDSKKESPAAQEPQKTTAPEPENPRARETKVQQMTLSEVVCSSIKDSSYKNFKNADELSNDLIKNVLSGKDSALKLSVNDRDAQRKNIHAAGEQKEKGIGELTQKLDNLERTTGSTALSRTDIEVLATEFNPTPDKTEKSSSAQKNQDQQSGNANNYGALVSLKLKNFLRDSGEGPFSKKQIIEYVEYSFMEDGVKSSKEELRLTRKINSMDEIYHPVIKNIYGLKNALRIDQPSPFMNYIFDESGGLHAIYYLTTLTLTAVMVFALLYLILIPLKHLFFFSTNTDVLTDHAKKFLEKRGGSSAGAGGLSRAIITTVAAVGIGTAAAVASNPFAAPTENKGQVAVNDLPEIVRQINNSSDPRQPGNAKIPDPAPDPEKLKIEELTLKIIALNESINILQSEIGNLSGPGTTDLSGLERELRNINGQFGGFSGNIGSIQKNIGTLNGLVGGPTSNSPLTLFSGLTTIDGKIGTPATNQTVFNTLNREFPLIQKKIGEPNSSNTSTIFGRLGNLSSAMGERNNSQTVLGDLSKINEKTGTVENYTRDTARYVSGTPGKNLFRQFQNLFSGQRYVATPLAVAQLRRLDPSNTDKIFAKLIDALEKVSNNYAELSADKLFNAIKAKDPTITRAMWKRYKDRILLFTRVTRY